MDKFNIKKCKPRIGLIISPKGLESITLIGEGTKERTAANHFCSILEQELKNFEIAIRQKFIELDKLSNATRQ